LDEFSEAVGGSDSCSVVRRFVTKAQTAKGSIITANVTEIPVQIINTNSILVYRQLTCKKKMSTLYIYTDNNELRNMLVNIESNRRVTDSGFDIPMLEEQVHPNIPLHTFNLNIKVAATHDNRPVPSLLLPRSSLSGTPFRLANSIGLIDMGYRGDVKAKVDLIGNRSLDDYDVLRGTRLFQICQGNFMPWNKVIIVENENDLPSPPDNRGAGGFGSTGN
jgi:dUTP pyrophosphatase